MNRRFTLMFVLSVLILTNLACGLGGKSGDEPADAPTATEPPAPTQAPAPTNTPEPAVAPDVALGEERRVNESGFAFRVIPDYTVEVVYGFVSMEAPDADPDTGPALLIMGSVDEAATTSEQLYDDFMSELEADIEASEPREVTVDGVPGLAVDLSGTEQGQAIAGRVVVVAVPPTQRFMMFGAAPRDRWGDEFAPLFDAVVASVSFVEPVSSEQTDAVVEVTRQWAVSAAASSEYGSVDWSAMQATGAPDTLECGDLPTAWASLEQDTVEWLELGYDTPVFPVEVNIIQTHSPNQVLFVDLLDVWGEYHPIYLGEPEEMAECPYTLSIPVEDADYQAIGVKITLDQSEIPAPWNEIDAVELVGVADRPGIETEDFPESGDVIGDVPAGEFAYQVTSADEDRTVVGGMVQDQSTTSEYVIGMVSEDTRYAVTLFLPHDVAPGQVALKPYDKSAATHGPGAAMYIGIWLYQATDGTLTIDSVSDDTVSGSFEFMAVREDDAAKTAIVAGTFNQLPLVKK
jgi:hypothetical protein